MALSVTHAFQSAKSDGGDATRVQPSNWNAVHVISMATARLLGRTTASAGAAEEISVGSGLVLAAGSLSAPATIPIGGVVDFTGTVAPTGWLFPAGQAISRTTYAALFAVVGTTYGAGNGTTTFNVPDIRGRVVAGKDDMEGTSANRLTDQTDGVNGDTLGDAGGTEVHTLLAGQLGAHTHGIGGITGEGGDHGHIYQVLNVDTGGGNLGGDGGFVMNHAVPNERINVGPFTGTPELTSGGAAQGHAIGGSGTHTHTLPAETASGGSNVPHNNVQPTFILNKIIYAGA